MSEAYRPTVLIYAHMHYKYVLDAICAGLEEEGVPFECIERRGMAEGLAHEAAQEAVLRCGIGLCGRRAVMTADGLAEGDALFATETDWKALGTNAARMVKRQRFKEVMA